MARYNAYALDRNKQIVQVTLLDCGSDKEASQKAAALVGENTIELWRDERRLRRFAARPAEAPAKPAASRRSPGAEAQIEKALACHRAGEFADAERGYVRVLRADKNNTQALSLLGTLRAQRGRYADGIKLLNRSLEIDAQQPFALNSLGNALNALARHEEALLAFDQSIALKSDQAATYSNGGNALRGLKRHKEALAAYRKAITIDPSYAEAYSNRGDLLCELKRYDEAAASYDKAIALRGSVQDWISKAAALQEAERLEEALKAYEKVLALKPGFADAHNNRGNIHVRLQRYEDALKDYDSAIRIRPDYAQAYTNRGNALRAVRRYAEALASYDKAIAAKPDYALAHHYRGITLKELGRFEAALASLDAATEINPADATAYFNKSAVLRELKRLDEALDNINKVIELDPEFPYALGQRLIVKLHMCDWADLRAAVASVIEAVEHDARAVVPFGIIAVACTLEIQRRCAETYARDKHPTQALPERALISRPLKERIHVAYLSADFHSHATAYLLAGVLEQHDRNRFEVSAVSFGKSDGGEMRRRLEKASEHFVDVSQQSDREVAEFLRARNVDIAVDLKGFTKGARTGILAFRPAPIQVNYLGYPGTMGASYVDYLIADRLIIPEDDQPSYTESIVYLPDTYQCNDSKRAMAVTRISRSAAELPEDGFIFCSFNNNYKITPDVFDVWMRLLTKVEGSVLWLSEPNRFAMRNLLKEAESRGVSRERLIFAPWAAQADHIARIQLADLFLDTLPCGAHTTASDAFWAGVPVLTCIGETFAGRVAASLLHAIGMPEMATSSLAEYEARALALARAPAALTELRAKLARNRETYPLFDTVRFTRHLEAAYMSMIERHRTGKPPAAFAVQV